MVGVVLIGCGYWGRNIARTLGGLGALAGVVDDNPDHAARFATEHGCAALTMDDVLADDSIEAVAVATPAATHHDIVMSLLRAGKDVFVEKPMALHPDHGAAMVELADDEKRVLMVGHLLQYHPAFVALKELVASGGLGRLRYLYSNRLNFGKIRREEDVLWSFAPHDLSMILGLAGEEVQDIRIEGRFLLHGRIADVTTTHMTFPSGLAAHVFVSWLHPNKEQRLVVIGDRAMAVFDDREPLERKLALYDAEVEWRDGMPVAAGVEPSFLPVADEEPLRVELQHFIDCVETRATPRTDGREGLRVLGLLSEASRQLVSGVRSTIDADGADDTDVHHPGSDRADRALDRFDASPVAPVADTSAASHPGVHPTAVIDDDTTIGPDTRIWHFSHVLPNSSIGAGCSLGQNVVVGPNVTIGDGVKIQNNVSVYDGVTLEDDVFCGPSMVFTNVVNPRAFVSRKEEFAPTLVKRGASIGANATVVCGSTVGAYAFVAAGAVVTKDVPDYALMAGVPARRIGWVSREGEVLDDSLICPRTGERYAIHDDQLVPIDGAADGGR